MSDLEKWIRNKNMTTNAFAELAQCSRKVIHKAKIGMCIDTQIAKRIAILTNGEVIVKSRPRGGRGNEHFHSRQMGIFCNI